MSNNISTNVLAATAQSIHTASGLSQQEEIFLEALRNVKQKILRAKLQPSLQAEFDQAKSCSDLLDLLGRYCKDNKVWKETDVEGILQQSARLASQVMEVKDFMNGLVMINQLIGGPTWGSMMALFTLLQNYVDSKDIFDSFRTNVRRCVSIYSKIGISGRPLDPEVRDACVNFNEVVIEFYLLVIRELSHNMIRSFVKAISKDFYQQLKSLLVNFKNAAEAIQASLAVDTNTVVRDLRHAQAFPPAQPHATAPAGTRGTRSVCLPNMLSPTFVGRVPELSQLARCLDCSGALSFQTCVLFGIPGVGKSQLAMRYAFKNHKTALFRGYDYVLFAYAHDKGTLLASLCQIGDQLRLFNGMIAECDPISMSRQVQSWLMSHDRWLFIFDDVSDSHDVLEFLPGDAEGHVLITTKSSIIAESLTERSRIIEVHQLDERTGVDLVLLSSGITMRPSENHISTAREIVHFTHGLPLAIDQLIKLSRHSNLEWQTALELAKDRKSLLTQRNFCSSHERNLPVGAIISTSLTMLSRNRPTAAALFQLLVYMDIRSIPLSLLNSVCGKIDDHFQRANTYEVGQVRSPAVQAVTQQNTKETFFIFNYSPTDPKVWSEMYNRMFHRGAFSKKYTQKGLPRVDSSSDIELQNFWSFKMSTLRQALADVVQLDNALNHLDQIGLVRRIGNQKTIWIHDLFAELTQALVQDESAVAAKSTAHLAATMVYLKFPIPRTRESSWSDAIMFIPLALRALDHLERMRILNDATVGAELSHLVASAITWTGGLTDRDISRGPELIVKYYRCAVTGYLQAINRLEAMPKVTRQQVISATIIDFLDEVSTKEYTHRKISSGFERFGYSALWRSLQSMYKLASTLVELKRLDEALPVILQLIEMNEAIFGADEDETIKAVELSMNVYVQKAEFDKAYAAAVRKAEGKMGYRELARFQGKECDRLKLKANYGGLIHSEEGAGLALHCADCAFKVPGKERTALVWFHIYLLAKENIYGPNSKYSSRGMAKIGLTHEKLGELPASIFWLSQAVDVMLAEKNANDYLDVSLDKFDAFGKFDHPLNEVMVEFRRVHARVKEEGVVLDSDLEYVIDSVEGWCRVWENMRPELPVGPFTERVFPDEEYSPIERDIPSWL